MRAFLAFLKKEVTAQVRSGRITVLLLVFVLLGIMNPAVAKLTPWMLELFSESFADLGITVTEVTVTAADSWMQFFKNIPLGLIVFLLLECGILTGDLTSGTLLLVLTKGLPRYKAVLAKTLVLAVLFSLGFWLCFGITYCYNAYFWDNAVVSNLGLSALLWWLFGMLTVLLLVFFSTVSTSTAGVLLGTGGVVLVSYLFGLLPKVGRYFPTQLTDGTSLLFGASTAGDYAVAATVTAILCAALLAVSLPIFNRRQI